MAERLAPDRSLGLVVSRPERLRRSPFGWTRRTIRWLFWLASATLLAVVLAHFVVTRTPAPDVAAARLIPTGMPARALVVLARPGQEVPMAGTLAALDASGVQVRLLTMTRGEAQEPRDFPGTDLAAARAAEAQRAGLALGVDETTSMDTPDGHLLDADPATLRAQLQEAVADFRPSILIAATDLRGGDTDSQVVAGTSVQVAQESGSGIGRVWAVTRSQPERTWLLRSAPTVTEAAPDPTVAVRIVDMASFKDRALAAHGTMSPALAGRTYPLADRLPAWAYFRFWDREYFALTWGQPVD